MKSFKKSISMNERHGETERVRASGRNLRFSQKDRESVQRTDYTYERERERAVVFIGV